MSHSRSTGTVPARSSRPGRRADPDGRVAVAIWNGTLDQSKTGGGDALARSVGLEIDGLRPGSYEVRHHRVDGTHSNIAQAWEGLGRPDWPDEAGWTALRAADRLEALTPPRPVDAGDGRFTVAFDLPMPAMSLIELVPDRDDEGSAGRS